MALKDVKFPESDFHESGAREFVDYLIGELGVISVANTLRTVLKARQRQELVMKVARQVLRTENKR